MVVSTTMRAACTLCNATCHRPGSCALPGRRSGHRRLRLEGKETKEQQRVLSSQCAAQACCAALQLRPCCSISQSAPLLQYQPLGTAWSVPPPQQRRLLLVPHLLAVLPVGSAGGHEGAWQRAGAKGAPQGGNKLCRGGAGAAAGARARLAVWTEVVVVQGGVFKEHRRLPTELRSPAQPNISAWGGLAEV